jgi:hypothetical protein
MSTDIGASYIPQIQAAYTALLKANESKLTCAKRLGEVLNQAKETVMAQSGKGAFGPWLELHCPEIGHRMANYYMRIAKHKDIVDEAFSKHVAKMGTAGDLSIRAAIKAVDAAIGKETKKKPSATKPEAEQDDDPEDDDAQVLAGLDVEAVLRGMAECWDAQQQRRLLSEQIKSVEPWDLAMMVEGVWDATKRAELIGELSRHTPPAPPPSDPMVMRRKLPSEQPSPPTTQ